MKRVWLGFMVAGLLCSQPLITTTTFASDNVDRTAPTQQDEGAVFITKIRTGRTTSELVEIQNDGENSVDMFGWQLLYYKNDGLSEEPDYQIHIFESNHYLQPGHATTLVHSQYAAPPLDSITFSARTASGSPYKIGLMQDSGYLVLTDALGNEVDLVGFGASAVFRGAPFPNDDKTFWQRCLTQEGRVSNSENNRDDFLQTADYTVGLATCPVEDEGSDDSKGDGDGSPGDEGDGQDDDGNGDVTLPGVNLCEGVLLSEVAANVSDQFIEVYNETEEAVSLGGCQLKSERKNQRYVFPEIAIAPFGYHVVYLAAQNMTIIKTTTDTVYLLSSDGDFEVDAQTYENLKPDTSWSRFADAWQQTYSLTPGKQNIHTELKPCETGYVRSHDTGRCRLAVVATAELKPCAEGQERNPATNRCRKTGANASQLVPCGPGQERNPATNRCRSVLAASSTLVPCKPGQERNPATNRCRAVQAATTKLKPCAEGQERNPATNRCRKIRGATAGQAGFAVEPVKDSASAVVGWWALGGISLVAAGYASWEWRHEIARLIRRLSGRGTSGQ